MSSSSMTTSQVLLSQGAVAQLNQALSGDHPRHRAPSISTRRSSQSIDVHGHKHLPRPKCTEGKAHVPSRRSSVTSNANVPFSRKGSVTMMLGKRHSMSWMLSGQFSFSGLPLYQPIKEVKYGNTYKAQPDEGCKFNAGKVQKVLEATLSSYLADSKYSLLTCGQLAQGLTDLIRLKAKAVNAPRYKLVCNVALGQLSEQGLHIASRCLWDTSTDTYATATYRNSSLFAVATVHGVYFE